MFECFDPAANWDKHDGGRLPHWCQAGAVAFVTFRTHDSLPASVFKLWANRRADWLMQRGVDVKQTGWQAALDGLPVECVRAYHREFSLQFMAALDKGHGACVLKEAACRKIVVEALRCFDGQRYELGDFLIMPNHVHVLVAMKDGWLLHQQCESWKRFTARRINALLGVSGRFWQAESFDHLVRSPEQFEAIRSYIRKNPEGLAVGDYSLCVDGGMVCV